MPLRVVIDAIPITGASTAIVTDHLLAAWAELDSGDEIHVVIGPEASFDVSPKLVVHRIRYGPIPLLSRLWSQTVVIPRLCKKLNADAALGLIASTTFAPLSCPRAVVVHDMRHELRPDQFRGHSLLAKRVSYWLGYRQAQAIACISERTRDDLLAGHPYLQHRLVGVVHHGADHTATWPARQPGDEYAIAFGQYVNKNVELVLQAWGDLRQQGRALPLKIFGLGDSERKSAEASATRLGLSDLVTMLPWLPHRDYQAYFTSASVVVFPSDFEGFGLPAIEAMALGIPLVISSDAALQEVTGGHAVTMAGEGPAALAAAVVAARQRSEDDLAAARAHASQFTWARSARTMRALLEAAVAGKRSAPLDREPMPDPRP